MAEEAAAAVGADADVNTAAKVTDIAMAYLQDEVTFQMFSVIAQNENIQSFSRSYLSGLN